VEKKLAEIRRQTWFGRAKFIFIETASPERERELFAPFCEQHPNCRLLATDERQTLSPRPGPFTAWRTELRETIGMFDEQFMSAVDKNFWARLVEKKMKLGLIKKLLYLYTKSSEQLSKSDAGRTRRAQDQGLLDAKPYPVRWPVALRRQVYWLRHLFRLCPGCFTVAP